MTGSIIIWLLIFSLLGFYFFGKKIIAEWVTRKLLKVKFHSSDSYVSGDLKWAICYDSSLKKFAFFRIFKRKVDLYHITHIKKCEVEIFEGKTKRTISLPNTLAGALTGRIIGGKKADAILTGAAIGAATTPNLLGSQEVFIKNIFLYVVTTNNAYRIKFKRLLRGKTNDNNVAEAIRWNKLINHLP